MKKLLVLFALVVCSFSSYAVKTVTFTLIKGVCDTDGILVMNYFVTPPFVANIYGGSSRYSYNKDMTDPTDTIFHYNGGRVQINVYKAGTYIGGGSYGGAPPFTFTFSSTPAILPGNGTATVTVTGGTPPYSYHWFLGYYLDDYKGSANPISLPPGPYGVAITDAAGCWYSSLINAGWDNDWDTIKGYSATEYVNEVGTPDHFALFPNPATDVIHINGINAASIILCNAVGQVVTRKEDTDHISVAALPAGVYVARLYNRQGMLVKQEKVLKQ
ncbi:MAG: hypothetical protein JWQ38_3684 [Flavipsychrobacter sp.]|nr:hypothetical protein [Flavipsychrobacter sp.]